MERFTGTIGNPSVDAAGNKTIEPVGVPVDIVFYAKGKAPIIRTTKADGKYDFTLANGSYQVSMYLSALPEAFRIRADLRDGEFFVVATNSPTSAFQEWIDTAVDANKPEDNPIIKHIQGQLDAMQVILDQFRDETQSIGSGKFVKESVALLEGQHGLGGYRLGEEGYDKVPFSSEITNTSRQTLTAVGSPSAQPQSITGAPVDGELYGGIVIPRGLRPCEIGVSGRGRGAKLWFKGFSGAQSSKSDFKEALTVGDYGLGQTFTNTATKDMFDGLVFPTGFYAVRGKVSENQPANFGVIYHISYANSNERQDSLFQTSTGEVFTRNTQNGLSWVKQLSTYNTIVDSNGNYKPASPVIQLHHDRVEYNEDFDKDNPPEFEHLETGVYRITNVREICKDGWTYNKPLNGKSQPYFMIKYEQEDETTLLVRVFERTFDKNTGEFGFGEPRDIDVDERWIDFHFEVDHERIAREEAQMQKEQEEFEEQERLRKEAEDLAEKEAQEAWEAEMAKHEAEMLAEM